MKSSTKYLLKLFGGGGLVLPAPALTSPADEAVLDDTTPAFVFTTDANATSWRLQIDNEGQSFASPVVNVVLESGDPGVTIDGTEVTYVLQSELTATDGPFEWRVRIETPVASEWSEARSFNHWISAVNALLPAGSMFHIFNNAATITNLKGNANLNGAVQGTPALVNSPLGANQALELNANTEFVSVANHADMLALVNATRYSVLVRLNLNAAAANRCVYGLDNSDHRMTINSGDALIAVRSGTTPAVAISSTTVAEGALIWAAAVFNHPDKALQFRLYTGAPTLSLMTLGTDTAAVAPNAITTQVFRWGNRGAADQTVNAALWDVAIFAADALDAAELQGIIDLIPA